MSDNESEEDKNVIGRARSRSEAEHESAGASGGNPVKEMFLLAALYLPLGFFLWFFFGSALMFPTARLSELVLTGLFPQLFEQIVQLDFRLEIQTLVTMERQVEGRTALLNLEINPMLYAWGMALLFGLIMATPLTATRRIVQMLVGFALVTLVTVWGVFWEAWTDMAFRMGSEAAAAVQASPMAPNVIALCYQLGYLMFPAVIPVAAWILMNRPFIENHVLRHR